MHGLKEPLAQVDHARLADSTLGASFLLTHDRGRSKPSLRPRATPDEKETPPKAHCGAETHARISVDRILVFERRLSASRPLRTTVKYENHRSPERVCLHTGSELIPSRPCFAMRSCGAPSAYMYTRNRTLWTLLDVRVRRSAGARPRAARRGRAPASTRRAHTHNTQQSQRQQRGEIVRANSAEHR